MAAGPVYGYWMANWLGWRVAYLIPGGLALLGLLFLTTFHQEAATHNKSFKLKFTLTRAQIIIITVASLWGFAHHGLFNFLPLYFDESVKTGFGAVLGIGFLTGLVLLLGIIGQLLGGHLGERFQRKSLYIWVVALNIPFLIMMAIYTETLLIGITCILGAVNFMFQPVNNSLLADETPKDQRGIIYGISAGISFGIGSLAGIVGGYIGEIFSINYIFPSMAVILVPAVILAILLKKIK